MKKLIIANWKMNHGLTESIRSASGLLKKVEADKTINNEVILCPAFFALAQVNEIIKTSKIKLGAQDVFWEERGAYTGEVSAKNLIDLGCSYVIIGHSERRQYFNETNEIVNKKIKAVLSHHGLTPIVCIGETLEQKNTGQREGVLWRQLTDGLAGLDIASKKIVIAYEPIWAIGTGEAISPSEADNVHKTIKSILRKMFGDKTEINFKVIYGGSVDENNAKELLKYDDVEGLLVGGASLEPERFYKIIKN